MAAPIKERGIRWVERYGDKSSYLKEEMESQVGPGSYFRWEGHDNTTATDYYVVVSPGYSKKKGYHFFAGLRKMPAEHGASGKKFKTMREALHYAYDMWRVPKPDTLPPNWQGYKTRDIEGKDIVLEGTHASSEKPVKLSSMTIVSPALKKNDVRESMSVQTMQGQYDVRVGPRVLPEQYCFAYMASPVTGFLPALYSRLRFTGVDAANFNPQDAAKTENLLAPGKPIPYSPLLATCEEPDQALFDDHMQSGTVVSERLYDLPKKFASDPSFFPEFKKPLAGMPDDVSTKTWSDMDVEMVVAMPAKASDDAFVKFWNEKFVAAYRQSAMESYSRAASRGSPDVAALAASMREAEDMQAALLPLKSHTDISDREFVVKMKARDASLFDGFLGAIGEHVRARTGLTHVASARAKNLLSDNFLKLYRRAQEIQASGNKEMIAQHGLQDGFDFERPYMQLIRLRGSQMLVYDDAGLPMALAIDEKATPGWRQEAKLENVGARYVLKDPVGLVNAHVPGFSDAYRSKDQERYLPMLSRFRQLASANQVRVAHDATLDARTVSPRLMNPRSLMPLTDQYRMPVDRNGEPIPPDRLEGMTRFHMRETDMVKPYDVEATLDKDEHGRPVRACRYFDARRQAWVYGPVLGAQLDQRGRQKMSGVPAIVSNASMALADAEGGTYEIARNEFPLYDPGSKGRFIPGDMYDINLGPEHASPKGARRRNVGIPNGFVLSYEKHKAEHDPSTGKTVARQYPSAAFTSAVPQLEDDEGKPIPEDTYALQAGTGKNKKVIWTDSLQAMRYAKNKLGLPDEITAPFTRMTMMDLKVIYERARKGEEFYLSRKEELGRFKDAQEAKRAGVSPKDWQEFTYGKTISDCGRGDIPSEVFKSLADAKRDPEAAFRPKEGQTWALWAVPPGKNEADGSWYRDPKLGIVFAADEEMARLDMNLPAISDVVSKGWSVQPRPFSRADGRSFMLPSLNSSMDPNPVMTYGHEQFVDYVQGESLLPQEIMGKPPEGVPEPQPEEPEADMTIQEGQPPEGLVVPSSPAMPVAREVFPEPREPEPELVGVQAPGQPVPVPEAVIRQERPRPMPAIRPLGPRPTGRPIITREDLLAKLRGMTSLANRLDKQGLKAEADILDGLAQKMAEAY